MTAGPGRRQLTALVLVSVLAGCGGGAAAVDAPVAGDSPAPAPTVTGTAPAPALAQAIGAIAPATTPYARAVDAVTASGGRVWIETDLLRRWLAGPASFEAAVDQVAALARRRGVDGIKIADELGYEDGTTGAAQVRAFLHDAAAALRAAVPGRRLLVDLLVPELGCLPWRGPTLPAAARCAADQDRRYPAITSSAVDGYLRSGDIDVLDLSVGLRDDATYAAWGVPRDVAVREAWQHAQDRGWDREVRLQARKALAHPGAYNGGAAVARRDVTTFVDTPISAGATAVDVWTWRQTYQGAVVRLLDPGLADNDLWRALLARHRRGAALWTHLSPSSLEVDLAKDVAVLRTVFDVVFVAAGTG